MALILAERVPCARIQSMMGLEAPSFALTFCTNDIHTVSRLVYIHRISIPWISSHIDGCAHRKILNQDFPSQSQRLLRYLRFMNKNICGTLASGIQPHALERKMKLQVKWKIYGEEAE